MVYIEDYRGIAPDPDKLAEWNRLNGDVRGLNESIRAVEKELSASASDWAKEAREKYAELIGNK